MYIMNGVPLRALVTIVTVLLTAPILARNASKYHNPIIWLFHPDPTCTFVEELDSTFFCTFSSFITFPGLQIYASRDLWDNFIITTSNPYDSAAWSDPVHFDFPGIDPSPFWDDDGKTYLTGSFEGKTILQAPLDFETGEVLGPLVSIWNGTGLPSPEAPHVYKKDGWYYLLTAEGGTRERHRSNMARSRNLFGPYEGDPANPILSVGHSDIFPDAQAVLTPVVWLSGAWPTYKYVSGTMTGGFALPMDLNPLTIPAGGEGGLSEADDKIDFAPGSALTPHLFHWRLPVTKNYAISLENHTNSMMLRSSVLNLTSFDGDSTRGLGQTFVARCQSHTRFRFSVDVEGDGLLTREQNEVGVTVLQDQAQHFDLGVVMLKTNGSGDLAPHIRFRGICTTTYRLPERFKYVDEVLPPPEGSMRQKVRLQVEAVNTTHYAFSAGLGGCEEDTPMEIYGYTRGNYLIPYYSGVVVGAYATSNGKFGEGTFKTYVSRWRYRGLKQFVEDFTGEERFIL
ncbi:uncharacterized protein CC84DRAFT_1199472 [Paraphaeosphaeria sporulosa]|uniref:Beta-xylosidase C-terminal Concanavalin A-like domain-containing protein n=1 Tax=Paraphaeosphaeria sporulosa TaxID=1460663 RepID=A0A177C1Z2_9PLEO|nr:uncharacterized protein CC84DRAFT_1199472 [Paraphaeosphaeria sporulosa]OAG00650.1 hypothetical protein CC84DRAFT_1199472 [Paraphaeosphaeria sporulosa]